MKKEILDHYSWICGYSIYHPVFYSCIKTNYTPSHVHSWPINKIYKESRETSQDLEIPYKNLKIPKEKGNLQAYQWANLYNLHDESLNVSDQVLEDGKKILLKRFAKKNDLESITSLFSKLNISSQDYYTIASAIVKEGSIEELLLLLEKGLESGFPPRVGVLLKIFEKAINQGDQEACTRIWKYFSIVFKDYKLERAVLLKLKLIKNDDELFSVFEKAKEWSVLSPRVKTEIYQTAKRISSKFKADWKFRLMTSLP